MQPPTRKSAFGLWRKDPNALPSGVTGATSSLGVISEILSESAKKRVDDPYDGLLRAIMESLTAARAPMPVEKLAAGLKYDSRGQLVDILFRAQSEGRLVLTKDATGEILVSAPDAA